MGKSTRWAFHLLIVTLALNAPAFAQVEVIEVAPRVTTPSVIDSSSEQYSSGSYGSAQADPAQSSGRLYYQLQLLQQEVMALRGQVEEQTNEVRKLKQQSLDRYVDIDRRLAEIGSGPSIAATPVPVAVPTAGSSRNASPTPSPTVANTATPGEYQAYRAAYDLVKEQRFDEAVTAFNTFLNDYVNGRYAPNAHYWLGELHLVVAPQDLESSRRAFMFLLEEYPDNSKVPDALYKLGKVYFLKGDRVKSREYLDRLIATYGDSGSTAVQLARTFLVDNF
ncbi:MAG: tol-pal system protein YbgF [Halieaceae bacterium]|jgi:tol-pal system protein YbgF